MTQQEALDILKLGYNVFLTGPPGSGKTFLLNKYVDYLKKKHKGVGVSASTGIAATHINGVTVHSWTGLGIKKVLSDSDMAKLLKKSYLRKRFKETGVLIIDEISMLNAWQFDAIHRICQAFKKNLAPFGGMQVVCSGDLFQLPPVEKERKMRLVVESNVWQEMNIQICYLEEQHRHKGDKLRKLLHYIRSNAVEQSYALLQHQEFRDFLANITPTKLYTHNADVDAINSFELAKIKEKAFNYYMEFSGRREVVAALIKSCLAPQKLVLKKNAQVMFVKNNFDKGYINGTRGRVIGFDQENNLPIIETLSGRQILAEPATWTIEENDREVAKINQLPLRLAWAITVHKSQGMNLDAAEIDLSKCFVEGMGYVALSRLKSLAGLKLIGLNQLALWVNKNVLKLDKELRQMSQRAGHNLARMSQRQKQANQGRFLHSLPQAKTHIVKPKPPSTFQKTKPLVLKKLSIKEIASQRGLQEETIISHLEKLLAKEEKMDLEYLRPPQHRFKTIKAAFQELDTRRLSPVYNMLEGNFSYQELRLARLFLDE